jgi:hypothetical protein
VSGVQFWNSDERPTRFRYNGKRVCPCGHPTLNEDVPAGKLYDAWPTSIHEAVMICAGGCGRRNPVKLIMVARELDNPTCGYGPLPLEVLDPVAPEVAA